MMKSKEDEENPSLCPGNKPFKWIDENNNEISTKKAKDISALKEIIKKSNL